MNEKDCGGPKSEHMRQTKASFSQKGRHHHPRSCGRRREDESTVSADLSLCPRFEIAVESSKKACVYLASVLRQLRQYTGNGNNTPFSVTGLEGAVLVACDTAQLLVKENAASIVRIETDRVQVSSRYDSSQIWRSKLTILLLSK